MDPRSRNAFALLISAQAAHSVEEHFGCIRRSARRAWDPGPRAGGELGHTMRHEGERTHAAIGLTVKSGWASAVVLVAGPATSPCVVDSRRLDLSDHAIPESAAVPRWVRNRPNGRSRALATDRCRRTLRRTIHLSRASTLSDARIRSARCGRRRGQPRRPCAYCERSHRIHALEGQLFRRVVEETIT